MIVVLWIFLILAISLISFFLALRSLKDYQDALSEHLNYSTFLIRNPHKLDEHFFKSIFDKTQKEIVSISFERLFKGSATALVVFAPKDLIEQYPDLNLLELEDYSQKIDYNLASAWEISPKKLKRRRTKFIKSKPDFLKDLNLSDADQCYFQIVCYSHKLGSEGTNFQSTIRLLVISDKPSLRTEIIKKINQKMQSETEFKITERTSRSKSSSQTAFSFKKRHFIPKEVSSFVLPEKDIIALLNQ